VTYGSSVTTPTVGASVSIPVNLAIGSGTNTTWDTITATIAKPNNSGIANESITAAATAAGSMLALSRTAEKNAIGVYETTAATVAAGQAGIFTFTPDVPGKYVVTLTATPGAAATKSVKTVEINVGGIAITQGATNLGKAITGTQILGRPSTFTFNVPAGAAQGARYTITSTGTISTVLRGTANLAAGVSAHTASTGITTVSGTTYAAGAIYTVQDASGTTTSGTLATANYPALMEQVSIQVESPAAAGTVDVKVTTADAITGVVTTVATGTVTYAAAPVVALATSAVAHLVGGSNTPNIVLGQADSVTSVSKDTIGRVATIGVKLYNASGTEVTGESYTATITGAGTLGTSTSNAIVGRGLTVKYGDTVQVYADGTSGVGTITISTAAGIAVATKSVSFYGAPAAIVLSVRRELAVNSTVTNDVVRAQVFDALGYPVNGAVVYAVSDSATIIAADYTSFTTATDVSSAGVVTEGIAKIGLTGVKIGSAKITVGLAKSATDVTTTGYAIKSDAATVNVVGSATQLGGVIVGMDKQSYNPGSFAWVTVTPVDAAGKKLAPGTYTVFSSTGLSGSMPFETVTAGSNLASVTTATSSNASTRTTADPVVELDGTKIYKIKLPSTEGDFTISWTTAAASNFPGNIAAGGVAGSVTVTLSNPGSQAAVDAAAEATDAANAATDAALAAADAADAATAAAEDASASVAKLSKSVTTALNNLKKQITSLTALVNKLLKR
jgi:hypothetical protein